MANQTNLPKKMDKILQKLTTLEANDKGFAKLRNYLAQLVMLAKQDSARQQLEVRKSLAKVGYETALAASHRPKYDPIENSQTWRPSHASTALRRTAQRYTTQLGFEDRYGHRAVPF